MGLVAKEDDIKSIIFSYNYTNINSVSREHTKRPSRIDDIHAVKFVSPVRKIIIVHT